WRLRRALTIETGLFEIQTGQLHDYRDRRLFPDSGEVIDALRPPAPGSAPARADDALRHIGQISDNSMKAAVHPIEFARCFLRLADLPNLARDWLSRYEAGLWRQVGRILFALDALDRRKPQERSRPFASHVAHL